MKPVTYKHKGRQNNGSFLLITHFSVTEQIGLSTSADDKAQKFGRLQNHKQEGAPEILQFKLPILTIPANTYMLHTHVTLNIIFIKLLDFEMFNWLGATTKATTQSDFTKVSNELS
jgi:hypothetical protein